MVEQTPTGSPTKGVLHAGLYYTVNVKELAQHMSGMLWKHEHTYDNTAGLTWQM